MNPYTIVKEFERAVAEYTGAPYVVAVNSCTMALLLAVEWKRFGLMMAPKSMSIEIPKKTYVGVPMSIIHAGCVPTFRDEDWGAWGHYQLKPLPVVDSARWFCGSMWNVFQPGSMVCVSFHASKTLGDTQGGAILHDNAEADRWLRKARFDGRTEGIPPKLDDFTMVGWHCYMSVDVAARLLLKLGTIPKRNAPMPPDDYPDLSEMRIFK